MRKLNYMYTCIALPDAPDHFCSTFSLPYSCVTKRSSISLIRPSNTTLVGLTIFSTLVSLLRFYSRSQEWHRKSDIARVTSQEWHHRSYIAWMTSREPSPLRKYCKGFAIQLDTLNLACVSIIKVVQCWVLLKNSSVYTVSASSKPVSRRRVTLIIFVMSQRR